MLTPLGRSIVTWLRHGPLTEYELAAELDQAPFAIRAELKALGRDKPPLIRERWDAWELTDAGHDVAWSRNQLTLDGLR